LVISLFYHTGKDFIIIHQYYRSRKYSTSILASANFIHQ